MELILNNKKENTNKIIVMTVVVLTLFYGLFTYSNRESKVPMNLYQQNYMYNSVDTFSVR
jgi:hypothetical protein